MEQEHALLDAVALRSAFEGVDQVLERFVETVYGVAAFVFRIVEELIVNPLDAARFLIDGRTGRRDHVIDPLERVAGDFRLLPNEVEVFLERANPVFLAELIEVLTLGDQRNDFATVAHCASSQAWGGAGLSRHMSRFSPAPPRPSSLAASGGAWWL